ncbi:glycosyl hydrolase family 28-related protein [Sphingomonas sp. CFBP8993]|uniref:glycosyl hydrolase family 28-related protein n=1 Tax=Sphingomonas sp. CFBP8993 TaxID=3096526 RepID=UPI002A6AA3CC|nr:glycosyl hydrolase family 28-related protein [Sphingomonas sp. CFBP8993]MDY0960311.1 glycosyl hydrolase family 28-related protein [Sphingomonas sp. CFBP8993]
MTIDRRALITGGTVAAAVPITQALRSIGMPPAPPQAPGINAVSVLDFGAVGDGQTDDSAAVQRAYDTLVQRGGGRLYFPTGRYRIALVLTARSVHLSGTGASSSILIPASADAAAVTALYRNGAIAPVSIHDLGFRGFAGAGSLFSAGGTRYVSNAEYSGETHFARCAFAGATRCIERRFGSIDLQLDQCQFDHADYHIHVTTPGERDGADLMHGGCLVVRRCWLSNFEKAMLFVDSPVEGSGQITLEQNIVENGRGFVHYFRRFRGSRAPGIVIRDQWNEGTATGRNLTIGQDRHPAAQYLFADQVTPTILIENSPVGNVTLRGSSIATRACDLSDFAMATDGSSSVAHELATAVTGTVAGLARSVAAPIQRDALQMPWFHVPLPRAQSLAFQQQTLFADPCSAMAPLKGSRIQGGRAIPQDAALPGITACTEVMLRQGDRLFPTIGRAIPANHWIVVLIIYRMMSGEAMAQVTGARGMSSGARLSGSTWQALTSICRPTETDVAGNSIHLTATADAVVRLGGIALIATPTLEQSLDFANALLFPATVR